MTLFLLSFAVMALAMAGLCAGVLLGRAPLERGCGKATVGKNCRRCRAREKP